VARNLLVVTTVVADEEELSRHVRSVVGDEATRIWVVAPAAKLSRLDWLTNDEDRARAEASEAAERVADAADVEAVGIARWSQDSDVAQAVEDALRNFAADEILVLTRAGDEASWLEDETLRAALDSSAVSVRHVELAEEDRPPGK
jgi:ATP-dependent exoDNAse (exonuclease V) beta subunit